MTTEQIDFDRKWFFDYFRQRVKNVESLSETKAEPVGPGVERTFDPDQHVLIAAGLDSLAKYWGETTKRASTEPHSQRFAAFLVRHGDHPSFDKLAIPHLLARAAAKGRKDLITKFQGFMQGFAHGLVRKSDDDPELAKGLALVNTDDDRAFILKSGYGSVLYKEYRCGWVHEFQGRTLAPDYDPRTTEPRYQNFSAAKTDPTNKISFISQKRPYFPKVFLLETYKRAVTSFEKECEAAGTCPPIDG